MFMEANFPDFLVHRNKNLMFLTNRCTVTHFGYMDFFRLYGRILSSKHCLENYYCTIPFHQNRTRLDMRAHLGKRLVELVPRARICESYSLRVTKRNFKFVLLQRESNVDDVVSPEAARTHTFITRGLVSHKCLHLSATKYILLLGLDFLVREKRVWCECTLIQ